MTRLLTTLPLCLALAACAAAPHDTPDACDGRHRRPANPNGSILLPAAPAAGAETEGRPPHAGDPRSFAPCGDDR